MNSEINNIYNVCKHIAENKNSTEVNDLLVEELSELIKAVIKLERYNFCDNSLRCNYHEIYDNIYEELADVIIMICQFIYKRVINKIYDDRYRIDTYYIFGKSDKRYESNYYNKELTEKIIKK